MILKLAIIETTPKIKLYGAETCHKTNYYKGLLDNLGHPYEFLDVIQNESYAEELRNLYENRKLNFPTITIGKKKLRNPYKEELVKWLNKLIPQTMVIGLGTAAIGRPQYINIRQGDFKNLDLELFKKQGFQLLEEAYNLGVRYFDTAPGYGLAERLLLEWLQTKNDATIEVATKWGYTYVANFKTDIKVHEIKEHSLLKLNEQWETSKAFASHLKVYQIHSATLETGVLENAAILDRLAYLKHEYGLEIGITTTGDNQTEVIKRALDVTAEGKPLFDAFQVTYNVLDQSLETISNELNKHHKKVIIKEALANGRLFRNTNYKQYNELYSTLEKLAKTYNVGTDAIALQFCQQSMPESIVLSGASTREHLVSNLKANSIRLSEEDCNVLKNHKIDPTNYWQERKQLAWN